MNDEHTITMSSNATVAAATYCPTGKKVLGGGCAGGARLVNLLTSTPVGTGGWDCQWHNASASSVELEIRVHAICATVP